MIHALLYTPEFPESRCRLARPPTPFRNKSRAAKGFSVHGAGAPAQLWCQAATLMAFQVSDSLVPNRSHQLRMDAPQNVLAPSAPPVQACVFFRLYPFVAKDQYDPQRLPRASHMSSCAWPRACFQCQVVRRHRDLCSAEYTSSASASLERRLVARRESSSATTVKETCPSSHVNWVSRCLLTSDSASRSIQHSPNHKGFSYGQCLEP